MLTGREFVQVSKSLSLAHDNVGGEMMVLLKDVLAVLVLYSEYGSYFKFEGKEVTYGFKTPEDK